mmetsp:Transcript_11415/g.13809  ORF Transcript_11415/g.13809 Transcript_11415/m.13809 type:complete len:304 (-) Transcript_11415:1170-2081(-)|eukprot:CAMPEP_0195258976 /NCGR_PEP_ID=MMETSP0706-20130129/7693_1 /TAXON_ID=33640 /ORGANISM="Asterionellopsis glacialis, Strain CCMP134" /LENGTH=303 /DNA_ID=CAMNT_0040312395 /DNA_START=116 /DNA_END=1027 /DNA_ORIENTATION=-
MAITYEEALSTLTSMFGTPWTKDTLDLVLRHHEGHMENTVESVLGHGDGDPQVLIDNLKKGKAPAADVSLDEELARQLANEEQQRSRSSGRSGGAPAPSSSRATGSGTPSAPSRKTHTKGLGNPTDIPSDFLRIPGYAPAAGGGGATAGSAGSASMDEDERLARMLQDELFSEELARNPQFAHLTTGPRGAGGRVGEMPTGAAAASARRPGAGPDLQVQGRQVLDKIGEMGTEAKKKLQLFAANFNAKRNHQQGGGRGPDAVASGGETHEHRSLLDDPEDDELGGGANHMEMGAMGFGSKKTV